MEFRQRLKKLVGVLVEADLRDVVTQMLGVVVHGRFPFQFSGGHAFPREGRAQLLPADLSASC
jgi:hypothetical protein